MSLIDLICIPSIWPEPLSRVVFEAFSLKKPVLSSLVGGQDELVNNQNGWLAKPRKKDLIFKLNKALKDKKEIARKGEAGFCLINRLKRKQIGKLVKIYKNL